MYANLQRKYTVDNFKAYKAYRDALNRALQSAEKTIIKHYCHLIKIHLIDCGRY